MKKILSVFVAICISAFGVTTVSAATNYVNDYFKYTVESSSVTIINYYGQDTEVTVPSVIAGNPVNTIAAGAFSGCANVKKITLPNTITDIEEGAFGPGQSVVYQKNSVAGSESSENETDQTASANSSSVADNLQENSNQNTEQTVASQSEETKNSSVSDTKEPSSNASKQESAVGTEDKSGNTDNSSANNTKKPSSGVDEQDVTLGSEDNSKQDSATSNDNNSSKKIALNYIWIIVIFIFVLFVVIVGGIIYLLIRKKRG